MNDKRSEQREFQTALGIMSMVEQEELDHQKSQQAIQEILNGTEQEEIKQMDGGGESEQIQKKRDG